MRIIILAATALIGPLGIANAQDKPVPKGELQKLIVGQTITAGGSLSYGADGRYTYNGGSPGTYRIANGRICVDFDNGRARCDKIVKDAGNYYLITSKGDRFQFKR
ncbi:MAG: hypothetical protein J0I42_18785 [Bosea sp.]|uniref:hypothetical protein n=1 Tax=Bosea sp. (in: a-proteobacteria) TaxID=1871050 RepID=UPI001AC47F88|nr:hypothetical protein [Bosea sp. (in: a-proteobacteria)]MBN9453989.1 hypothetical protein [Bosea sp. (in: a-proteobacteria)]